MQSKQEVASGVVDPKGACKGCVYLGKTYNSLQSWCEYVLMEQKQRPCTAGDGCTVKVEGKRMPGRKASWNIERARELWEQGKSAHYIALSLNVKSSAVNAAAVRNKWTVKQEEEPKMEEHVTEDTEQAKVPEAVVNAVKRRMGELAAVSDSLLTEIKTAQAKMDKASIEYQALNCWLQNQ